MPSSYRTQLLEDLAVPYVVRVTSVKDSGGWLRRAEYPELPGCFIESYSALDALEDLDALRVRILIDMRRRGEQPPRPRPPLSTGLAVTGAVDVDKVLAQLLEEDAT
jgi:hypothetical protein